MIKCLTKCRSLIQYASFDTFRAKIGRLFTPKSVFEVVRETFDSKVLSHLASELTRITILKEIQALIVE